MLPKANVHYDRSGVGREEPGGQVKVSLGIAGAAALAVAFVWFLLKV